MADVSSEKLRRKIKDILKDADLSTLSAKKVRLELQKAFDVDLSERKKEIDKMTMNLIMEMEEKKKEKEKGDSSEEEQNGQNQSNSSENEEAEEPPKKKTKTKDKHEKKKEKRKKREKDDDDDDVDLEPLEDDDLNAYDEEQKTLKLSDEELAKRLQSFEETGRRTRNKATPRKKEKKKSGGGGGGNSVYSRPCLLSHELAGVMGTDKLARNEIVKKMWEIVKERKLQDPKDKRFMICDEQLQKIFGRKRVQTFGMMKYLSSHIRDESSSLEAVITNSDIYDDEADDD